jgi:hypothetical protein
MDKEIKTRYISPKIEAMEVELEQSFAAVSFTPQPQQELEEKNDDHHIIDS